MENTAIPSLGLDLKECRPPRRAPVCKQGADADGHKHAMLLAPRPIQGIMRVVRWLRNKNDLAVFPWVQFARHFIRGLDMERFLRASLEDDRRDLGRGYIGGSACTVANV